MILRWWTVAAVTSCTACGFLAPKGNLPAVSLGQASYRLAVGDQLRIDVFGEAELSLDVLIETGGTINYPLLGRVKISGMTPVEVERDLTARLEQGYLINPRIRVNIARFRPIYVVGQVRQAGSYAYVEGLTVEKSLALAGGLTPIASSRGIFILRGAGADSRRQKVELHTAVYPGDTIIVEESLF